MSQMEEMPSDSHKLPEKPVWQLVVVFQIAIKTQDVITKKTHSPSSAFQQACIQTPLSTLPLTTTPSTLDLGTISCLQTGLISRATKVPQKSVEEITWSTLQNWKSYQNKLSELNLATYRSIFKEVRSLWTVRIKLWLLTMKKWWLRFSKTSKNLILNLFHCKKTVKNK